jgi:hypothetical protein
MPIQLTGLNSPTTIPVADATMDALHVSSRSMESFSWQMVTTVTGNQTLTVAWVNTSGAGTIWSLRNSGPGYLAVRKVQVGFRLSTAFTTAMMMDYGLAIYRNHTIPFNAGGTLLNTTSGYSSGKLDRRNSAPQYSIYTATTAGLTAPTLGGVIPDTNLVGYVNWWNAAAGAGIPPNTILFESLPGEAPIILRPMESVNVVNMTLMTAAGVGIATINCEFAEIPPFAISSFIS